MCIRDRRNIILRGRDTYDYTFTDWIYGPTALTPEPVSYTHLDVYKRQPFGSDSIDVVGRTTAELQKTVPAMADAWTKNNLVFLGGMSLDTYHIWTKFPLARLEDLQGRKISAPGPSANWIRGTGAVGVALSLIHI